MYESKAYFYGTGRRKHSVSRVRLYPGTGKVTINNRDIDDYFGLDTLKVIVRQPFEVTNTAGQFDVVCTVSGGGVSGQAGAIRHGIARALLQNGDEMRPMLKKAGLLTRDPRMKERKKYGPSRSAVLQEIICQPAFYILDMQKHLPFCGGCFFHILPFPSPFGMIEKSGSLPPAGRGGSAQRRDS